MAEKKILVIDADAASRNFVARALQHEGHHALQAGSGKEGCAPLSASLGD